MISCPRTCVDCNKCVAYGNPYFWSTFALFSESLELRSLSFSVLHKFTKLGRTPKEAHSLRGRSRHLLENWLLKTLLRTLFRILLRPLQIHNPPPKHRYESYHMTYSLFAVFWLSIFRRFWMGGIQTGVASCLYGKQMTHRWRTERRSWYNKESGLMESICVSFVWCVRAHVLATQMSHTHRSETPSPVKKWKMTTANVLKLAALLCNSGDIDSLGGRRSDCDRKPEICECDRTAIRHRIQVIQRSVIGGDRSSLVICDGDWWCTKDRKHTKLFLTCLFGPHPDMPVWVPRLRASFLGKGSKAQPTQIFWGLSCVARGAWTGQLWPQTNFRFCSPGLEWSGRPRTTLGFSPPLDPREPLTRGIPQLRNSQAEESLGQGLLGLSLQGWGLSHLRDSSGTYRLRNSSGQEFPGIQGWWASKGGSWPAQNDNNFRGGGGGVRFHLEIPTYPTPQKTYIHKRNGDLIFGSLHNFHVIHSLFASRSCTWKAGILCLLNGVGHYIERFLGNNFGLITWSLCNEILAIT